MIGEKYRLSYFMLSFFLWLIPLISVRYSSETWSGLLFVLGLGIHFNQNINSKKQYWIGLLFGLSFLFRFQIVFSVLGFLAWLIFIDKIKINGIVKIVLGAFAILGLGVLVDSWFYGQWVFTPWNYFYCNIVEDVASGFGVSSWMFYFQQIVLMPSLFIGILISLGFILLMITKYDHFLIWIILPFILIHSIIPHKEDRFLFPLVYLLPLLLMISYQKTIALITNKALKNGLRYSLMSLFLFFNIIGLFVITQKSAGIGRMKITQYIHNNYGDKNINLVYCIWSNPYNPWQSLPVKFYLEKSMTHKQINNLNELNDTLLMEDAVNLLVIRKADLKDKNCESEINKRGYEFEEQSIQPWILLINHFYMGISEDNILLLYKHKDLSH